MSLSNQNVFYHWCYWCGCLFDPFDLLPVCFVLGVIFHSKVYCENAAWWFNTFIAVLHVAFCAPFLDVTTFIRQAFQPQHWGRRVLTNYPSAEDLAPSGKKRETEDSYYTHYILWFFFAYIQSIHFNRSQITQILDLEYCNITTSPAGVTVVQVKICM